jgi:hypothetical protein
MVKDDLNGTVPDFYELPIDHLEACNDFRTVVNNEHRTNPDKASLNTKKMFDNICEKAGFFDSLFAKIGCDTGGLPLNGLFNKVLLPMNDVLDKHKIDIPSVIKHIRSHGDPFITDENEKEIAIRFYAKKVPPHRKGGATDGDLFLLCRDIRLTMIECFKFLGISLLEFLTTD